jgi:protein-tyrosine phosphatase
MHALYALRAVERLVSPCDHCRPMSAFDAYALAGGCNLRDVGGLATADGRRVRRGRLLRSGVLTRLTPAAVQALQALPVRAVCDLRRTEERARHPNPSFGPQVRRFEWDTGLATSPIRDEAFIRSESVEAARGAMVEMYRRIPFVLQSRLAGAFAALAHAGDGATIVHCSAGKDRTGVAIALILESLGVAREHVVADYVRTREVVDLRRELFGDDATGAGLAANAGPFRALPRYALDAVLDAHPDYVLAALDAVEERHGSVEHYLLDELGLAPALLVDLRERLLEACEGAGFATMQASAAAGQGG